MPVDNPFPRWGDSGDKPPEGTQFNGGDRYPESYVDYLWSSCRSFASDVQTEFDSNLDANTYKGNDIDTNGDGIVNEADYAFDGNATQYKGNDIDTDGDGVVNKADDVSRRYRNTDVPRTELKSGDIAIGREVWVPDGWRIRFYEYGLQPANVPGPDGLFINATNITDNVYLLHKTERHGTVDPSSITDTGPIRVRMEVNNGSDKTVQASGGFVWTLEQD